MSMFERNGTLDWEEILSKMIVSLHVAVGLVQLTTSLPKEMGLNITLFIPFHGLVVDENWMLPLMFVAPKVCLKLILRQTSQIVEIMRAKAKS